MSGNFGHQVNSDSAFVCVIFRLFGPLGVLEIWGEWPFIFRDLRSTGNYFQGLGEQAHSLGDLGSPAKKF